MYHVLDAEVTVEDDTDPNNSGGYLVTISAEYEGETYSLSAPVGSFIVHLNYYGDVAQQYTFKVPKAIRKDYAVFKFSSLEA